MLNVSTSNAFDTACCPAWVPGLDEVKRTKAKLLDAAPAVPLSRLPVVLLLEPALAL